MPFAEGEYAKAFMLDVAIELLDDFLNKDKIIKQIKDMPLYIQYLFYKITAKAKRDSFKRKFELSYVLKYKLIVGYIVIPVWDPLVQIQRKLYLMISFNNKRNYNYQTMPVK